MRFLRLTTAGSILSLVVCLSVRAQTTGPGAPAIIQAGIGIIPGVGTQIAYVSPRGLITFEGALYVDVTPSFGDGEGSVQVSTGLGGALRPLRLARLLSNADPTGYDIDFGLRFGPGLFFAFNETRATANQRFSLFLEPFLRFTSTVGTRTYFIEAGIQRPLLRGGLWFSL